jgi:catalase
VHTFRLVNAEGKSTFVKFHWRPKLGLQSTVWDEAMKIAGADPDFHRRDLFEAIEAGQYPEWELGVQLFTEEDADKFPFDHLDATKLIPEELVELTTIGRLVLDRWPDNFFAETEQVAFCPANIVPGIDFSNDPLLQGRLFSYLDTQLIRLGGPNFQQIPINSPQCPFHNLQRDGYMQMRSDKGRVNYEPASLQEDTPRETPEGFTSFAEPAAEGIQERIRAKSFADHYSQARLFYRSQTRPEQAHIASAFVFELSKVQTAHVREAIVGHLRHIDMDLAERVAQGLGMTELPPAPDAAAEVIDMKPSPAVQLIGKMKATLQGRTIGILIDNGTDAAALQALTDAASDAGAMVKTIAPVRGTDLSDGTHITADAQLAGSPSVVYDAVALVLTEESGQRLTKEAAAVDFVRDAFGHLKAIAANDGAQPVLDAAAVVQDAGIVASNNVDGFVQAAKMRQWAREPNLRTLA